ncbi:GTPase, putative [Plasmodium gallinaceum]|uniref:GTPase, putative n=1 Tax=Plasmodium gallinaceum TaxID=5849 RepID=A0A1J1H028_PLAGA|nr:GTPase, putative [Plasmodium gallinaceum]CRG98176.1 GTPase, putative [Plasmodium gallinaceum]
MFFNFIIFLISINFISCIKIKSFNLNKNIDIIGLERNNYIRRNFIKNKIIKNLYFLNNINIINNKIYLRKNIVKNEENEKESFSTFDEYFNKKAEENYTKLEADKLKILKENIHSYKDEIKKAMEKSYKNEYKKLLKEEEEDNKLSNEIHENIKITFHMNKNINNFLFTEYSYMINKLKERSVILKNLRKFYNRNNNNNDNNNNDNNNNNNNKDGNLVEDEVNKKEKSMLNINEDDIKETNNAILSENQEENVNILPKINLNSDNIKKENNELKKLMENVQFFKPEQNLTQIRNCQTFSDQLFANAKIESNNFLLNLKEENEKKIKDDMLIDNEDTEQELFLKNNVSALQLFKENVKSFLHYKKANIIKSNLNEDLLYGRVKVHWFPKFMKRVISKIPDYIKISDIIIEVRNGIIPFVFDDLYALNIFDIYTNKPRIIVYTNSDRSSIKGNEEWGSYYRRKLYWYDKNFNKNINKEHINQMKKSAVIFVNAKDGKKEIIVLKKLINRLCQNIIDSKKKKGIHNYKVKCIFIGLPNVGKSALINRILEFKKTKSYDYPGLTTNIQMYSSKKYELIDTPGILSQNLYKIREKTYDKKNMILEEIYNYNSKDYSKDNIVNIKNYNSYMHVENNIYLLALCNHISPKMYDIYNVAEVLMKNLYNAYLYDNDYIDLQKIIKRYQINFTECLNSEGSFCAYNFIQKLARDRFHNDLNQASMRLVTDFRKNYLGRITLNYPIYFNKKSITLKISKNFIQQKNDKYVGW